MKNETERLERAILKIGGPEIAATVLEAAGKVDKSMCLSAIGGWQSAPDDVVAGMAHDQVVALLSALPDEEPT
jgi:hypothetical protein